eukprot:GEMP01056062.1.p1 GENE.GEMP01056062.1~~GEMP01056062.1.p1  ORF type:complete len:148 (-),score=35.53 GEMP01056062.1:486-929(-)
MLRVSMLTLAVLGGFGDAPKPRPDLDPDEGLRTGVFHKPADCERKSESGDQIEVHYTGWTRKDGKKFDSSRDRETPFEITLGAGMVIKGWDLGLLNMCVGEKRRLTIPSGIGYGASGSGEKIPGGATLMFDVEMIAIKGDKSKKSEF